MSKAIRCTILRAGTSKGVYLLDNDLPRDAEDRERTILKIFGSPDKRQIDGLGGADPLTSKTAIVGPSTRPGIDIEYTFGQVSIDQPKVFYKSLCGNISSGVAPFAINSGLVAATEPITTVHMYNRNTGKVLVAEVPVKDGRFLDTGDYAIAGVPGTGAKVTLDFRHAVGALTGRLFPTGRAKDIIQVDGLGELPISIIDMAACQIFINASSVGLSGKEKPAEVDSRPELLRLLETIRCKGTVLAGMAATEQLAATEQRNTPHLVICSAAQDYDSHLTQERISKDDIDFTVRMMFMQIMHKTYAGTGSICTAVASCIPGTVINEVSKNKDGQRPLVRLGHPGGIIEVETEISGQDDEIIINKATIGRTARQIMTGQVFIKD